MEWHEVEATWITTRDGDSTETSWSQKSNKGAYVVYILWEPNGLTYNDGHFCYMGGRDDETGPDLPRWWEPL